MKRLNYLFLFFVFYFTYLSSFSQNPIVDSLLHFIENAKPDTNKVDALNQLSSELDGQGDFSKANVYANDAITLCNKLPQIRTIKERLAIAYTNIGYICEDQGFYNKENTYHYIALKIYEEIRSKKGIANVYNNMGNMYYRQGDFIKAKQEYLDALKLNEEIAKEALQKNNTEEIKKAKKAISSCFGNIGNIYYNQGDFSKAIEYSFNSLKVEEELGMKDDIPMGYNTIGLIYDKENDYPKALHYFLIALDKFNQLGQKVKAATTMNNVGLNYWKQHIYQKALEYQLQSLKIREEAGDKLGVSQSYTNIGLIYLFQNDSDFVKQGLSPSKRYSMAMDYEKKALSISQAMGDIPNLPNEYIDLGTVYYKMKNYNEARKCMLKSHEIAINIGSKELLIQSYHDLSLIDSATGNFKQAYENFKNHILYRDSLVNDENTKKTVRAEMNFDFDKKQAIEKEEQEKKDAINAEELKRQKAQRNYFIIGFTLMLLLALFIFRSYRQKNKANKIIAAQKKEVEIQKHLVEEKNKEITDSISYAKRLQQAILPPEKFISHHLPGNFVLFKPKDIVAGDFYWMETVQFENVKKDHANYPDSGLILIAAADCTGHGVPGAMVSVVCSNALNRTVKEFGITDPGKILDKVRELVIETFEKSESEVKDGMDISLCSINTTTLEVKWAGANNPLWYTQKTEMKEIKANKQPIGKTDAPLPFTTHYLQLNKGDELYLFTDGYADQFGGNKGKKFKYKPFQNLLLNINNDSMSSQKKALDETIENWKGNLEQVDDILIIGIRV